MLATSVSYSVNEVKKIASALSASFLNLIYYRAGMVVHLLLLKSSMGLVVTSLSKLPNLCSLT